MIDILIPVLNRPGNVQPLVDSIREETEVEHRVFFICSRGDRAEIDSVRAAGLTPLIYHSAPGPGDFSRKINWAFDQTDGEWIFQGADDIRFCAGWDVQALTVARRSGASVIGTNDLHNPSVRRRNHSTHTLIRRSYIEEQGGTIDGHGVFHEGYDHWFCDNELVETAKARKVWAFSDRSIVEHFHPHWGNAPLDSTYEKAMRHTDADRKLFLERMQILDFQYGRRARYSTRR